MRILVTTDQWSPDVVGGAARVAADTARALARRGHDVVAVAPRHAGRPTTEVEPDSGVEVRRVLRRGPVPQTFADPVTTFLAARSLRPRRFDVVLAHEATNAAGASLAGTGAPLALVFHASAVLELRYARQRSAWPRRAAYHLLGPAVAALERAALRRAAGVIVLSRYSATLVEERDPLASSRLFVVGGGVPDSFFASPEDLSASRSRLGLPSGTLLLTARRLEPRMGIDALLDAVRLLGDTDVVLLVTGDGSLRGHLERRIRTSGLEDRVRLLGRVSDEDLRDLYAAADLFVLPSEAYEGFGMSTVEALAAGTPVLGTAVGATPEIVSELDGDLVVPSATAEALADGIRSVLPRLGPELRRRARRLAEERYRWDVAIVRWEEALQRIGRVDAAGRTANL